MLIPANCLTAVTVTSALQVWYYEQVRTHAVWWLWAVMTRIVIQCQPDAMRTGAAVLVNRWLQPLPVRTVTLPSTALVPIVQAALSRG